MEQTTLRPKPMPGQEPEGDRPSGTARRPHAAPRRAKRLTTALFAVFVGTVLVLSGIGLGTLGATVIGMSKLAELQRQAGASDAPVAPGSPGSAQPGPRDSTRPSDVTKSAPGGGSPATGTNAPARATLGVEAVDAPEDGGALLVGVHVPGPAYTAGLVRGDTLLSLGGTRVTSAADLVRAIAAARPGTPVGLVVRHANGARQELSAVPGVVT
ncbi:PDZ domain-containing protein [Streptomyces sp. NPDC002845]